MGSIPVAGAKIKGYTSFSVLFYFARLIPFNGNRRGDGVECIKPQKLGNKSELLWFKKEFIMQSSYQNLGFVFQTLCTQILFFEFLLMQRLMCHSISSKYLSSFLQSFYRFAQNFLFSM